MNLLKYKKYAWYLLLPIAAYLIYAFVDIWEWHKYSDADIIQEVLQSIPASERSGRKVMVISDADDKLHKLLKEYAGISPEVDFIIEPESLQDFAKRLQTLRKKEPLSRLTFFGIGTEDKDKITLEFRGKKKKIDRDDFLKLQDEHKDLPYAFGAGAQLVFFNCFAGNDEELLKAAGEAFLSHRGGTVIANTSYTDYGTSSYGLFWTDEYKIITRIERPNEIDWVSYKITPK